MRIVGGVAKGRRLAPAAPATRPTSDRVREALFNTLSGLLDVTDAHVLDLFAGTGAVGLEALSRGAAEAVFVESDRTALTVLRRNIETLALPGARIVAQPVAGYLGTEPQTAFDLVFADPPYDLDDATVDALLDAVGDRLATEAVVVVERGVRSGAPRWPSWITPLRERRYGDGVLWYGRRP